MMDKFNYKNILITGGMGFIGSNFIRFMLNKNDKIKIINLDLFTYAASEKNIQNLPDPKRHTLIKGNIINRLLVDTILKEFDIDTVIHFAAESHVDRSIADSANFIETNIVGTHTLLEATREFWLEFKRWGINQCRFYHISTDEIYGSLETLEEPSFLETSPYHPRSPYSASKAASNHLVSAYYHTYQLPILISNSSNNYGPFQHLEKFIPKVIHCCLTWKPIPIYGDGSNIRDWLHVEDHCDAIKTVLELGDVGQSYNIGANNELSNIAVVNKICTMMDHYSKRSLPHNSLIQFVRDRPGHDWRYSLNCEKIFDALGWKAEKKFDLGLKESIDFYIKTFQSSMETV